jgi:hypothetical protein
MITAMITAETNNLKHVFHSWEPSAFRECQIPAGVLSVGQKWKGLTWLRFSSMISTKLPTELDVCEKDSRASIVEQENSHASQSDQSLNGWIAYVKEVFYSVPDVESIYLTIEENNVDLWLVIPKRDFKLVRRLVELEMRVLNDFVSPQGMQLFIEFHIMYRCGVAESQLIPREAIRL